MHGPTNPKFEKKISVKLVGSVGFFPFRGTWPMQEKIRTGVCNWSS